MSRPDNLSHEPAPDSFHNNHNLVADPRLSESGLELKPADTMALVSAAIQEITKVGISAPKLSERLAAFQSLVFC